MYESRSGADILVDPVHRGSMAAQFSAFGQVRVLRPFKVTLQKTDAGRGAVDRLLMTVGAPGDVPGARFVMTASVWEPNLIPSGGREGLEARGEAVFDEEDD